MRSLCCIFTLLCLTSNAQDKESALFAHLADEVRQRTTPLNNSTERDYVGRTGARLAQQFNGITFSFETVTENIGGRMREPISLPGGEIFVPAPLILAAADGGEFAGMLAHAMAHAASRHGFQKQPGGVETFIGHLSLLGDDPIIPFSMIGTERQYELDADRQAARAMSGAGYDPRALARYIRARMQPDSLKINSALPPKDARLAALNDAIEALPQQQYTPDQEFPRIQEELRRLNPPAPPPPSLLHPRNSLYK